MEENPLFTMNSFSSGEQRNITVWDNCKTMEYKANQRQSLRDMPEMFGRLWYPPSVCQARALSSRLLG